MSLQQYRSFRFHKTEASLRQVRLDMSSHFSNFGGFTCARCIKTFYVRNLLMFVLSWSVCPWQTFPAQSYVGGYGQEPTLEWSTWKVLLLGMLRPYPKILDQAGMACQGQTLQLIMKTVNYGGKKFYSTGPRSVCPWQVFPAQYYVCWLGQEPALQWSTRKVLHLGRALSPIPKHQTRVFIYARVRVISLQQ